MLVSALELRIALIVVALIVVIIFYVWYRASNKDYINNSVTQDEQQFDADMEDFLTMPERDAKEDLPDDLRFEFEGVSKQLRDEKINARVQAAQQQRNEKKASTTEQLIATEDKELLMIMHVVAKQGAYFTGPMIKHMMAELDLQHGEMGAYHYSVDRLGKKHSIYMILNMFQPGSFDIKNMADLETRGLTLVLQLPGPEDALKSYNIMCEHAQRLATFLNGDLLDQDQNAITTQAISHYKEQVQLFGLRVGKLSSWQ
jgi:cell division protein ZipA